VIEAGGDVIAVGQLRAKIKAEAQGLDDRRVIEGIGGP
jgi:hypothetical protein